MFRFNDSFTVNYYLVTFDRNNFTSIFIHKIFCPCFQYTSSQFASNNLFQVSFINLYILSQIENFKNILIIFKSHSSQQSCYRKFLLTVDVRIHHIVDIRSELNPRSFKRDNTSRIQFGTIGMDALTKEYTRRTVQLRNNHTFSTINYEGAFRSHIRNRSQIHILNHCVKIFVIGVGTIKLQFSFQRYTICQATFQTIINCIVRRINIVVKELEHEVIACISYREVFRKNFIQAIILSLFGWGI